MASEFLDLPTNRAAGSVWKEFAKRMFGWNWAPLLLVLALAPLVSAAGETPTANDSVASRPLLLRIVSRFTVEAKIGVSLTQAFTLGEARNLAVNPYFGKCGECATQRTVPYVIGPALEVRLSDSYSLSGAALYSRAAYNHTSATFSASGTSSLQDTKNVVNRWEFPVLVKRTLARGHVLRPFVAAGISTQYSRARTTQALIGSHNIFGGTVLGTSNALSPVTPRTAVGPVVAGGIHIGHFRWGPTIEMRYTRWLNVSIEEGPFQSRPDESSPATIRSAQNQLQLLVGFAF